MAATGVLRILGPSGDTRVEWDVADPAQVDEMRRRFDEIIADGYLVFALDDTTLDGRQVHEFEPRARQLRAFRPLQGG